MNNIPKLLTLSASRFPQAPAVEWAKVAGQGGISYSQLHGMMRTGANVLRQEKLRPGDKVLLHMESRPEWAAALFSILEAGLVAVPLPIDTPPAAIAGISTFAEAKLAILSVRTRSAASVIDIHSLAIEEVVGREGADGAIRQPRTTGAPQAMPEFAALSDATMEPASNDLAILAFTSGSTAQPRGVELTHANILADLKGLRAVRAAGPGDAFLSLLPPAHLFELTAGLLGPLACGARVVYPGSLLPNRVIAALREEQITHTLVVPALLDLLYGEVLEQLVDAGELDSRHRGQSLSETARRLREELAPEAILKLRNAVRTRIGSSLRTCIVGGAALDPAWREISNILSLGLEVGYGLTEASPVVSLGRSTECPPGSVGQPLPGVEVRVNPQQEILVRGANVMRAYYKNPEATAAAFEEGWLRTGDRGHVDADGFLFVTGRFKEAIVGATGETVYPDEAEPYYASPLFSEYCVAALRGTHGNDLSGLFIVPTSADISNEELREAFESLRAVAPARLRVQRLVRLAGPLPRTSTGKVKRRSLTEGCREDSVLVE